MKKKCWPRVGLIFILSISLLLSTSFMARAEEAKYIYDELGRLHQVIDEEGNAATYNYDAVGNLLSITRSTGVTGPQITSISPDNAFGGETVNVTISGNNLIGTGVTTNNPGITISDVKATTTSITAIFTISFIANHGPTTVTVKNSLGVATTIFTVNPPSPTINALQPSYGPVTRFVTFIGTGFRPNPADNQVKFNGVAAQIYSSDPYRILTRVPAGATSGLVTVTTNGGTSNGLGFTVTTPAEPPPTITSIVPNMGSVDGGSVITVNGTGFIPGTKVYIAGNEVQGVGIINSTSLNVTTPRGTLGTADVLLSNDYGDVLVTGGFTYIEGPTQQITATNPTMGMINIPINTRISVILTRPVDRATVTAASFSLTETSTGTPVSGTFSFDFNDTFIGFAPSANLNPNTSHTLNITRDIKSQDGIPLDRTFSGSFTTSGSADTVSPTVSVTPANGAAEVPVNTLIIFNFSEPVSPTAINTSTIAVIENGIAKTGFLTIGQQNRIVTFTPYSNFSSDAAVIITLSQKITDVAGNRIVGSGGVGTDFISSFTTTTTTDLLPPRVISINPPNNSTGISVNTTVSVAFSESIDPLTINSETFTVSAGETQLTGQITLSNEDRVAIFIPDQPLPQTSVISVALAAGIRDTAGNATTLPFTSTFTTHLAIDNYQPSVIRVSPYNNQAAVPLNSEITIVFDERINPSTVTGSSFYVDYGPVYGSQRVAGNISVSSDGLTATFMPSQLLAPGASYTIFYTSGIKDLAGNPLYNPGASYFTTGVGFTDTTPPQILEISPVNGATGVPVNVEILLRFSEALDRTTVTGSTVIVSAGGVPVQGDLIYGANVVRFKVANFYTLEDNTYYQVTVTTGVKDTAGNPLGAEFVSGFTTGNVIDGIPPDVVSVVPANNATNISPVTNVEVTFTEPLNPMTINSSTFGLSQSYPSGPSVPGTYTLSSDRKKVTFTPDYPLFAGNGYYIGARNIEDVAGNKLPSRQYYFTTGYAPGTNPNTFPNAATVVINPNRLFADGVTTTTVEISNINRSGVLAPNGTKVAVTATPTPFRTASAGGVIQGGVASGADPRFKIFTTVGGKVTLTYQSPNLYWLTPGAYTTAYIQVACVDAGDRPVSSISTTGSVTLFRGKNTSIDPNPVSLLANGSSYSEVNATVYDYYSQPVPAGMRIGVTAEPVYRSDSLGGTIQGGEIAIDTRFKIFQTITGGTILFNYTSPALTAGQTGKAWIQVVEVDDEGGVLGLIGYKEITLSASEGYTAPQPRVLSVSPAHGQSGVGLNVPVIAEFSQSLDPSTVTGSNFSVTKGGMPVSGSLTLSNGIFGSNTIVTFAPTNPWASNSSYYVFIGTGIKSTSGNPLLQYSSTSFSTGISFDNQAPYVVGVNPSDGMTEVPTNSVVTVQFSDPMASSTINGLSLRVSDATGDILGKVVMKNSTTFSFIPDSLLSPDTQYTVTVAETTTDIAGNHLASAFASTFATQSFEDRYQPSIIQVSPYNNQLGVALNSDITIVFDEPIDPLSVNSSNFYTERGGLGGDRVSGPIIVSDDGFVATLTPSQPLLPNMTYFIKYSSGIKDVAGNSLYNPDAAYFTTGIELADTTPPEVWLSSPANGTTGVPIDADIVIRFSETLDRTTINGSTVVVSQGGVPLAGNLTFEQGGLVVRYVVANLYTFAPNALYEVRVTTGVRDTAGNALGADFVSGFTTGNALDAIPPDVVSVVPANGATNVSPDTSVEVTFTEPIDPVTVNSSTFGFSSFSQSGTYTISQDRRKVTFVPDSPFFAGTGYSIVLKNIEDLAGNKLSQKNYYFTTAYAPGTNPNTFPNAATVVVNPNRLFADGLSTTTVEISNINRNGALVPNGTKIAVTAAPTPFRIASAGGVIQAGVVSSADPRFKIFTTVGGKVTLTYQSPNLYWLTPGAYTTAYIQVACVDAGDRPVSSISTTGSVTLFRGKNTSIDPNPVSLLANGSSYSEVNATIYDYYSQPVPAGMRVGVTAEPVYRSDALGGTIQGGEIAIDSRFKIFQTITGGTISFNYTSPTLTAGQSGKGWIQVVEVDDAGQVVGLLGDRELTLSGSTGYTAPQPRVISVSPTNGQSGVGLNVPVIAEFSQSLDPSTVTSSNFSVTKAGMPVSGSLTLSTGVVGPNTIVTFLPANPWASNSSYSVYIGTGIKSSSGNPLLQYSSVYFSTGISSDNQAPYVVGVNPPDGAIEVATNSVVTVQFSEPMAPSTINRLSFRVSDSVGDISGKVVMKSSTNFSFIPDSLLNPDTPYTVTVAGTITDIAGNHLGSGFTSTFATQSFEDRYQPSVIQVSPYNGQTGVALSSDIAIVFDEPIDPLSVNSSTFYVTVSLATVSGTVTVSEDGLIAIFTPFQPLLPNTSYSIKYTSGIKDVAGNSLYNPDGPYFTTGVEIADTTPPQVLEISPLNGATNVPINAEILFRFSETLDRTTVNGSTLIVSAGGVPVQGDLTHSGNIVRFEVANLYTFAPNTLYEVRVTTGVKDTAGNALGQEFVSGFTTGSAQDTIAPDVVSVVPAHGATNVSWDPSVEVTFTEPIDPITVNNSTFALDYASQAYAYGAYVISSDKRKATLTPYYPLFAGHTYYVRLANIEDLAGNKLTSRAYYFTTAYSPGTDVNSFPTWATVAVNPNRLFADGVTTTTVEISNINRSGVLVPNGTKIAVTATSGSILGGTDSPDPRFRVFTVIGGKVTLTYRSPNLDWLAPGVSTTTSIQVVSVDAGDRPVSYIGLTGGAITLFRGKSVSIDPNPLSLLANGSSYSEVNVTVYDNYSQPVPAGMRVGVTAEPVYRSDSLGGTIQGGEIAVDGRFKIFRTTTGGKMLFNYTSPALAAAQTGKGWIQVVEVNDSGQVVGLLGDKEITMSGSTGYTAPQPRVISVSPVNGQSGVSLNVPVVAEFSQPLDPSTVTTSNFSITKASVSVSGTLALSAGIYGPNTIVTFAPTNPWAPNTSYTVYIGTGIKSVSGNALLIYIYSSFSTGVLLNDTVAPLVSKVNPSDGITSVAINASVSVIFSEPMNPSTLNPSTFKVKVSGAEVAGRVDRLGPTYFRFVPDELLLPDTQYQVSIDASVKDAAGNPMASPFTSTFTTQTGMDNYQPAVISVSPSSGTIEFSPTNPVVITFSEPMDPITLSGGNCSITGYLGSGVIPSTITLSAGNTQMIITPIHPLFAGGTYYVRITASVKDIAGNGLPSEVGSTFTTALAPGTGNLPNGATITINPTGLFASGEISTTATISNIKYNGIPVPNGTLIAVTTAPAYNLSSAGGVISGPSVGTSIDPRFLLFSTEGASVTVFYTPPETDWLTPGATADGVIQVASVDSDTRPASLIVQDKATLFRVKTAALTANPTTLPADGASQSTVAVVVRDNLNNLVPDGTEVGITISPVFVADSAGGTIVGGIQSGADSRVQIFNTTTGGFSFVYQAPNSRGPGYAVIQAVTVNNQGAPTGLISSVTINLN